MPLPRVVRSMSVERVIKLAIQVIEEVPDDGRSDEWQENRQIVVDDLQELLNEGFADNFLTLRWQDFYSTYGELARRQACAPLYSEQYWQILRQWHEAGYPQEVRKFIAEKATTVQ